MDLGSFPELEVKKTATKITISDVVEIGEGKNNIEYANSVFLPFFLLHREYGTASKELAESDQRSSYNLLHFVIAFSVFNPKIFK